MLQTQHYSELFGRRLQLPLQELTGHTVLIALTPPA